MNELLETITDILGEDIAEILEDKFVQGDIDEQLVKEIARSAERWFNRNQ